MSKYQEYRGKPIEFLALTGSTLEEFEALLPDFGKSYCEWMTTHRLDGKPRGNRRYVDYKNSPLPTNEEKLFFILAYLKTNNLQTVQGALFGISQPKANLWIHCLHTVLSHALDTIGELPARRMEDVRFDEEDDSLFFHDGTERPIQRPVDPVAQREYYSGKKTAYGEKQYANQPYMQGSFPN